MCTPKSMGAPLKIAYAYSQKPLLRLFRDSGWTPKFISGESLVNLEDADLGKLKTGVLLEGQSDNVLAEFYGIRSIDIPRAVSLGYRDVGLVGTDNLEEKNYTRIVRLGKVSTGRTNKKPPTLELWANNSSSISSLREIPPGTVILSEREKFTAGRLAQEGYKVIIEGSDANDPQESIDQAKREGAILIVRIAGGAPQQLEKNDLAAVVNETGGTKSEYNMKSIGTLCVVETWMVANEDSLRDPEKNGLIEKFVNDIEGVHAAKEVEAQMRGERRL